MSRLIDANGLKRLIAEHVYLVRDSINSTAYGMFWTGGIEKAIDEMPTVEERKTGKWIFYDSDAERYDDIRCSVCGKHFTVDAERWCDVGFIASDLKYCPNCGARME